MSGRIFKAPDTLSGRLKSLIAALLNTTNSPLPRLPELLLGNILGRSCDKVLLV